MALPSNVGFCHITGRFLRAVLDGNDDDRNPDGVPLANLTITFTSSLEPAIVRNSSAVPPVTILVDPIVARTNADGVLIGADEVEGIYLVASDDPDLDPTGWTYKVTMVGSTFNKVAFSFVAPVNGEIDLSSVVPVPPAPGSALVAWQNAVGLTLENVAAAEIAQAAAEEAAASIDPGVANGVATLDEAAKVPDVQLPGRLAATALSGSIAAAVAPKLDKSEAVASFATIYAKDGARVIAGQGHSIMQNPDPQGDGHANKDINRIENDVIAASVFHSGGALIYGGTWAISGQTSTQVAARAAADAVAMKAAGVDLCLIMVGVNDAGDYALYRTKLTQIVSDTRAAGVEPVLLLNTPYNGANAATKLSMDSRNLIVKQVGAATRTKVIDVYTPIVDLATGNMKNWAQLGKQYGIDAVHPSSHGNMVIGKAIAAALAPIVVNVPVAGALDSFDTSSMLPDPFFKGNGAGWNVQNFATPAIGVAYETRAGYLGKAVKLTRAAGGTGFTDMGMDLAGSAAAAGDVLEFSCKFETLGLEGRNNQSSLQFQVRAITGSGELFAPWLTLTGDTEGAVPNTFRYRSIAPAGLLGTAFRVRLTGTAAYAETHYFGEMLLRNLTKLGLS